MDPNLLAGIGSLIAVLVTLYTAATSARKSGFRELKEVVDALQEQVKELQEENQALRCELRALEKENMALRAENNRLRETIVRNAREIADLQAHMKRLEEKG